MRPFRLEISQSVQRRLRQLPQRVAKEIAEAIVDLATDPYPPDATELGRELRNRYRIRVDGWRIIYAVHPHDRIVKVFALRPRDANTYLNLP